MALTGGRTLGDPNMRSATTKLPTMQSAPHPPAPPTTMSAQSGPMVHPQAPTGGNIPPVPSMPHPAVPPTTMAPGGGGLPAAGQRIDPMNSLRQMQLGFDVPQPWIDAPMIDLEALQQFGPSPDDFFAGGKYSLDATGYAPKRLNFNVGAQSVQDAAMKAWQAQLPQLNQDFADASDQLAGRTAAMGRTGSGLFNRETGYLSDRARAAREGLLGNLAYQAATTDAGNQLAASSANANLMANQEALMANQGQFMSGQALNAALAGGQNNLSAILANAQNAMQGNMFNAGNAINLGLERMGLLERQQGRQDRLAGQAQSDLLSQLGLLGQGFQGLPSQYDLAGAGVLGSTAGMFGQNASQIGGQLGQLGGAVGQGAGGGGGMYGYIGDILGDIMNPVPQTPAPIPTPTLPPDYFDDIDISGFLRG